MTRPIAAPAPTPDPAPSLLAAVAAAAAPRPPARPGLHRAPAPAGSGTPCDTGGHRHRRLPGVPELSPATSAARSHTAPAAAPAGSSAPRAGTVDRPAIASAAAVRLPAAGRPPPITEGRHSAAIFENCPGATCPGATKYLYDAGYPAPAARRDRRRACAAAPPAAAPTTTAVAGTLPASRASITLSDTSAPSVALAGGITAQPAAGRAGTRTLAVDGSDNIGIQRIPRLIDGALVRRVRTRLQLRAEGAVPERARRRSRSRPPGSPTARTRSRRRRSTRPATSAARAADDLRPTTRRRRSRSSWRSRAARAGARARRVQGRRGRNPPQTLAPIAGAAYRLCPTLPDDRDRAETRAQAQERCVQGTRYGAGPDDDRRSRAARPGPVGSAAVAGRRRRQPAARQRGRRSTGSASTTRRRPTSPSPRPIRRTRRACACRPPTRVSGIAGGAIEVRRDGAAGLAAAAHAGRPRRADRGLDDETLPKGLYFLRARAVNAGRAWRPRPTATPTG